jgi:hypothetical protein
VPAAWAAWWRLRPVAVTVSDPLWPPLPGWEAVGVGVGVLWTLEPSEGLKLLPGVDVVDGVGALGVGAGCEVGCGVGDAGALGVGAVGGGEVGGGVGTEMGLVAVVSELEETSCCQSRCQLVKSA